MPWYFPDDFKRVAYERSMSGGGEYKIPHAEYIYPEPKRAPHSSQTLMAWPHPLQFLPLQYESNNPHQRNKLHATDITMRLLFKPFGSEIFEDGFESANAGSWSHTVAEKAGINAGR